MDADREWWLRVPAVLFSPRTVFTALRNEERADVEARSEPVLALVLLAGAFAALTSSTARTLYDDPVYDGPLVVALWVVFAAVFVAFTAYFVVGGALRNEERADVEARSEPVLALVLLAGAFAALTSSTARTLYDDPAYDGPLVVALWVVFAAVFVAFTAYFVVGGALYLGARGLGSEGTFRRARHVLAFATAPLALAVLVLWPVELAVFGDDLFRRGGEDAGDAGRAFDVVELAFAAWAGVLLVIGVRAVHGWSWSRSLGALGLVALFLAAFSYVF